MAISTNGNQHSFLTRVPSADRGVKVFRVGPSLPLSARDKAKLSTVLGNIIEKFSSPENNDSEDESGSAASTESSLATELTDESPSH